MHLISGTLDMIRKQNFRVWLLSRICEITKKLLFNWRESLSHHHFAKNILSTLVQGGGLWETATRVRVRQRDQILRHFATFGIKLRYIAIITGFILYAAHCHIGQICFVVNSQSLKTKFHQIWSHWCTVSIIVENF